MNRILFYHEEISQYGTVRFSDWRARHILDVLKGQKGDVFKTGEVNSLIGQGEIIDIAGQEVTMKLSHTEQSPQPWLDLLLSPPRPRSMKRLLPQLSSLGVGRIVLLGAKKVEKDFWGATLLKEEIHKPLLLDGLMQAGTSAMCEIMVRRNFRKFIETELDELFKSQKRLVAHPYSKCLASSPIIEPNERLLLAIGPEGGWEETEIALLEKHSFLPFSFGKRILRTDTALLTIIGRLMPLG